MSQSCVRMNTEFYIYICLHTRIVHQSESAIFNQFLQLNFGSTAQIIQKDSWTLGADKYWCTLYASIYKRHSAAGREIDYTHRFGVYFITSLSNIEVNRTQEMCRDLENTDPSPYHYDHLYIYAANIEQSSLFRTHLAICVDQFVVYIA